MLTRKGTPAKAIIITVVSLFLTSCGSPEASSVDAAFIEGGNGPYNGLWNVTLTTKKDGCKLGVQTLPLKVAISQRASKAKIAIQGMKSYDGSIKGKVLTGSGTYKLKSSVGTTKLTGRLKAKLVSENEFEASSAFLTIRNGNNSCKVTFNGVGKR